MKNKSHKNRKKETYGKILKSSVRVECISGEETAQSVQRLPYGLDSRKTVVPYRASRRDQELPPPLAYIPTALVQGPKRQRRETDHSLSLSVKVKNEWTHNPTSSLRLYGVHRNNCPLLAPESLK